MQVLLAKPRGFCAGVDRAIEIVERALTLYGAPIYVRHEVVHNKFVVDDLRRKGAVTNFLQDASKNYVDAAAVEMENHVQSHVYDMVTLIMYGNDNADAAIEASSSVNLRQMTGPKPSATKPSAASSSFSCFTADRRRLGLAWSNALASVTPP